MEYTLFIPGLFFELWSIDLHMTISKLKSVIVFAVFFAGIALSPAGQDQKQNPDQTSPSNAISVKAGSPFAVPVLTPEEVVIANEETFVFSSDSKEPSREEEDLKDLDFSKEAVDVLLWFIPVSILLYFLFLKRFFQKIRLFRKTTCNQIRFSYSPLFLLLIVVFAQWINVFCNMNKNEYDSIYYEKRVIEASDKWSRVNDIISQIQFSYGNITSPTVFIGDVSLQEIPFSELKKKTKESDIQAPVFSKSGGYLAVPNKFSDKEITVYLERPVFKSIQSIFTIKGCLIIWLWIFIFWLCVQFYINKGFAIISKKRFRQKCLLVCLTSFSVVLAGTFWMSHISLWIPPDGKGYIYLACSDTIMKCFYGVRTPGYPLFLSVISLFSPSSFHSVIYFQTLIYLLSITWLFHELYKKGVPLIILLVAYSLFYNYLSLFFYSVLCESLEISCIAATAAIGLTLSETIKRKQTLKFAALLIVTVIMVFCTIMIKPFPGLILLPGCMMFLGIIGSIRFRKAFILTAFVGILSVLLPASYCALRWKMCGDFNFCSLINTVNGGYQLLISTPESLASERIRPEQRELAYEVINYFESKRPDLGLKHPWTSKETTYSKMIKSRMQFIYDDGGLNSFFGEEWSKLAPAQKNKFKTKTVYINNRCKAFMKTGDPELNRIMQGYYWDKVKELYTTTPQWISKTLEDYNPFQSLKYFHKTVTFPLAIFLLIAFLPKCKKIRYGSWKTIVVLTGLASIAELTFLGQTYFLGGVIFEARSEMVMFFSAMLGTILLSMYCIYSCIISFFLALRLVYSRYAPEKLKRFVSDATHSALSCSNRAAESAIRLFNSLKCIRNNTSSPTQKA